MDFGERKKKILSIVIEKYIDNGIPVGSKLVCNELDITVSSATVRNEMAELSELGYLNQPYTSAGRIPSYSGYRIYVDKLMKTSYLSQEEKSVIDGALCSAADDPENLLMAAADILSNLTDLTAILTTPPSDKAEIRDIQFIKTGRRNAMLILMTTTGVVKNKLFRCNYDITDDLLCVFREIMNDKFRGKLLKGLNLTAMSILPSSDNDMPMLMFPVVNAFMDAVHDALEIQIKTAGETNLLTVSELKPTDVLNILKFLRDKNSIIKVLMSRERGINVMIGDEEVYNGLGMASIITSRYSVGGRSGAIAVIGPTRMDYRNLISKIRYIASSVGNWLERILEIRG